MDKEQKSLAEPFSEEQKRAFEILSGNYGLEPPALLYGYIGRARRELALASWPQEGEPSCGEIVKCALALHKLALEQLEWQARRAQEQARNQIFDSITLAPLDRVSLSELKTALRDLVDIERARMTNAKEPSGSFGRLRLYLAELSDQKSPHAIGAGRIGHRNYTALARVEIDGAGRKYLDVTLKAQ